VSAKAFSLNFSDVLTKREENPRDTAPLSRREAHLIDRGKTLEPLGLIGDMKHDTFFRFFIL